MCLCIETDKTNGRPGEIRSISLMGFVVVISDIDIFFLHVKSFVRYCVYATNQIYKIVNLVKCVKFLQFIFFVVIINMLPRHLYL